jgi:hypothetical protein
MTRDEIIKIAKQAGAPNSSESPSFVDFLEAFAKLVAAKEREACAKLVEGAGEEMSDKNWDSEYEAFAEYAARTIRARSSSIGEAL